MWTSIPQCTSAWPHCHKHMVVHTHTHTRRLSNQSRFISGSTLGFDFSSFKKTSPSPNPTTCHIINMRGRKHTRSHSDCCSGYFWAPCWQTAMADCCCAFSSLLCIKSFLFGQLTSCLLQADTSWLSQMSLTPSGPLSKLNTAISTALLLQEEKQTQCESKFWILRNPLLRKSAQSNR